MSASSVLAAARTAMLVGQLDHARVLLDEALAGDLEVEERLEVLGARARLAVLVGDGARTLPALEEAAAEAEADHPLAVGRLMLDIVILQLYAARPDAVACANRARALTADADPVTRARAEAVLGLAHALGGETEKASALLGRAGELVRVGGPPDEVGYLLQQLVVGLSSCEQYTEALAVCRRYARAVRSVGADGMLPMVLCYLANSAYFTSDFDEMEMAGTEAFELATALNQPVMAAYALACRALVAGLRGEAGAVAELETSVAELRSNGGERIQTLPLMGLGLTGLAAGDWRGAAEHYLAVRRFMADAPSSPGLLHWRADEVEALWRAGRADDARTAVTELVRDVSNHGPWERAAAARVTAMLAGDPAEAEASFRQALELHRRSTSLLEQARTNLCMAEWLAGQGRPGDAHAPLQAALAAFQSLGANGWCVQASALAARLEASPASELTAAPTVGPTVMSTVGVATAPRSTRRVRGFGPLTIIQDDVEVRVALDTPGRLLRSLVAAGNAMHAEQLIDILWPDAPIENGSARLRTVLARVRKSYGPVVLREGAVLRWADDVEVDVHLFRELTRRAAALGRGEEAASAAARAVDLYGGDLLPLERYADDVAFAREQLRQRYLDMLDLLAEHEMSQGRPDGAAARLRTAIETDPLDEVRYVRLAALLLDEGRPAQAQSVLAAATRTITELGLEVSPSLEALLRRVSGTGAGET